MTLAVKKEDCVSVKVDEPVAHMVTLGVTEGEKLAVRVPVAHPLSETLARAEADGANEEVALPVGAFVSEAKEL